MPQPDLSPDALKSAVGEIAEFVDANDWGQPPTLFALVPTIVVAQSQPDLADTLDDSELTLIEQDPLPVSDDGGLAEIEHVLGTTSWPEAVAGCALVHEVIVLPPDAESDLDDALAPLLADPDAADDAARNTAREHPGARTGRLITAALRDGQQACVLHMQPEIGDEDKPMELLTHPDLAPGLIAAVAATLDNDPDEY